MTAGRNAPMGWLEKTQPGFDQLTGAERNAIRDFALLWSLYEGTVLDRSGSANAIAANVRRLKEHGRLDLAPLEGPIEYFQTRYFDGSQLTYHYDMLNLRGNDRPALVERFVKNQLTDDADIATAVLIIVLRFRNNLFHGEKWSYGIRDQLNNFLNANVVLMAVMDMTR
jgi:hypothetical protein